MKRSLQTRLRKVFAGRFSKDELRTLCFDLDIPHENLPEGLDGLAREMIVYCQKRDRVPDLIETARELRPDIDWEDLDPVARPATRQATGPPAYTQHSATTMDAAALVASTISLLSPYLTQIKHRPSIETSGAAWDKARQIHQAIVARLQERQDDYLSETFRRFEEQPKSRRGAMQSVLQEVLDVDPAFRLALTGLLREADQAGTGAMFNVNVFGGEVGEIINVDRLDGGLTIHKK